MGRRKIKGKRYNGVYEYYKDSDPDKVVRGYYIQYKDELNVARTKKCDASSRDEALDILNAKKPEIRKIKQRIDKEVIRTQSQKRNQTLTLDQYADIFHPRRENKDARDEKAIYKNHISPLLGKKKIARLTRVDIIDFRKALEKKKVKVHKVIKNFDTGDTQSIVDEIKLSPKTTKNILDYLRVILNNAVDDNYSDRSPLDYSDIKDRNRRTVEKKKFMEKLLCLTA